MVAPPGTTFQRNINDLIFERSRYAYAIQKHTKHTLFRVYVCGDSESRLRVPSLVEEQSSCIDFWLSANIASRFMVSQKTTCI